MDVESKALNHIRKVLEQFGNKYFTSSGALKRTTVIEDLDNYDKDLMVALLSDDLLHKTYTSKVADVEIFEINKFADMLKYKEYWTDSFTKFNNKIGLTAGGKYIDDSEDVVLDFPYKDTVLKAGMTKEEVEHGGDADEPFLNETLAKPEIDELLEPKIFVNVTKYDTDGFHEVKSITDDDNLVVKGNNLIALYSIKERFAGKIQLIYLDPPYNTGSDSFAYNDRFNHATWLTFMKSRLEIARNLLSDTGYIVIQTDDNEQAYLKILMDSIFKRENYINTVSILFKNIAGASGGGEDKRLKKNIEYLTIFSKRYDTAKTFNNVYDYTEIGKLVSQMRENGVSWKYTSVLIDPGKPVYIGSTTDSSGDEIKLYKRENPIIKSISQLIKEDDITEAEAYSRYGDKAFQTAMPQSSIRPRVMEKYEELEGSLSNNLMSITYVPKTGKHKGQMYEQFYKGDKFRLFAWLKDVSVEKEGKLYKAEKLGTYWNYVGATKNVNKEGEVSFPDGKKPEELLLKIIQLATDKNDLVMDMFLGSGSTAATAMKVGRRFVGTEQIDSQMELIERRLPKVISGDQTGISKDVNWQGGGSFIYAELMPKNQNFVKKIQEAQDNETLFRIFDQMKQEADIDFRVDLDKFEQSISEPGTLIVLDDCKRALLKILDKNQLYYNYADIDDADIRSKISDSDYQFNKNFYSSIESGEE